MNVITYGTFDFFHEGHRRILERAREVAGPEGKLFVGVTSENYDRERGKLNVCQTLSTRMKQVVDSHYADEVFIEEYEGQKIEDIQRLSIDAFVIGDDWVGKYDYLTEWCKVIYLPRTQGISSTEIRNDEHHLLRGGIVGTGRIAKRFIPEARFVSGIEFDAVCNPHGESAQRFADANGIKTAYTDFDEMLKSIDVVYIATPHITHEEYIRKALQAHKHVLCEKPITLSAESARSLYKLADNNGVILQEFLKTAFVPAFKRMINIVKGGAIGKVRQINATFTRLTADKSLREFSPEQCGGAISEFFSYVLCPIVKLLGPDYPQDLVVHALWDADAKVDVFTTAMLQYPEATGIVTVGLTGKSEGSLTIAGTKGYIFVPSPWWKTEYFEIRNDNGHPVKRFASPFAGDGLRYELSEFVKSVVTGYHTSDWSSRDSIATVKIIEAARKSLIQ